jgi:hypothetical protein
MSLVKKWSLRASPQLGVRGAPEMLRGYGESAVLTVG